MIWRKLDCLNPSLQKGLEVPRRKDACKPAPVPAAELQQHAAILRDAGAMSCQGIEGGERDAYVALGRITLLNVGSPTGRESYGDRVPVVVAGVTPCQFWRPGEPDHRAKGHR